MRAKIRVIGSIISLSFASLPRHGRTKKLPHNGKQERLPPSGSNQPIRIKSSKHSVKMRRRCHQILVVTCPVSQSLAMAHKRLESSDDLSHTANKAHQRYIQCLRAADVFGRVASYISDGGRSSR